jgi:hypothetical protein
MRFAIGILALLAAAVPASEAKSPRAQCKDQAQSQYNFCLKRSTTKKGRAMCKADLKTTRSRCPR